MKIVSLIDHFIPDELQNDYSNQNRARIIIASSFLLLLMMLTLIIPASLMNDTAGYMAFKFIIASLIVITIVVMKKAGSVLVCGSLLIIIGYVLMTVVVLKSGGLLSRTMFSYTMIPLFALLLTGFRAGIVWTVIGFCTVIAINVMTVNGYDVGKVADNSKVLFSVITLLVNITIAGILFELTSKNNAQKFEQERDLSAKAAEDQKQLLDEANMVMNAVAEGDLSKEISVTLEGELGQLKPTVNKALAMLSGTLAKVVSDASKILSASLELNIASQSVADGTTQQAASIEQISSSVNEIDGVAKNNEENAMQAQQLSNQAMTEITKSNEQMEAMLVSMQQINDTSNDVSKVIKVIDEIAFQTNLLALNAAVEAARAGKYGKGFAVVAEEVRNLASRSSEAAKNTTTLIESSINVVNKGVKNADQTATDLKEFVASIEKVNDLVGEISIASRDQSGGVKEISKGLGQVNDVVQQNSSISEETAAAAEELKTQAESLQNMVSRFKLKQTTQGRPANVQPVDPQPGSSPRLLQQAPRPAQRKFIPKPVQAKVVPPVVSRQAPAKPTPVKPIQAAVQTEAPKPVKATPEKKPTQIVLDDDDFGKY